MKVLNNLRLIMGISVATLSMLSVVSIDSQAQAVAIANPGTEGLPVVAGGGNVTATYLGSTAAFTNLLYFMPDNNRANDVLLFNNQTSPVNSTFNLGTFAAGTPLNFRLFVTNTGTNFFSGLASLNPDSVAHARVQANYLVPGTTLVSFEDLFGGPYEYNDLSFSFTNTTNATLPSTAVPEPFTVVGTLIGGAAAFRIKKRLKNTNKM